MSTLRVNTLQNTSTTDGGISINNSGHVTVDGVAMPSSGPLSNRNLIINGNFAINQRGGSNTTINTYALDRWRSYGGPMGFTISQQDVLSTLSTSRYAMRFQRTSGNTQTNNTGVVQGIESKNCEGLAGTQLTLSFKARAGADLSDDLDARFFYGTGTDENPVSMTGMTNDGGTDFTLTTSFATYTKTVTVPASTTQISLTFAVTPTGTAGTNDWFEVAEVQVERGSVATPFEHRSYGDELARCLRYYWLQEVRNATSYGAFSLLASYGTTTDVRGFINFPVPMRQIPALSISDISHFAHLGGPAPSSFYVADGGSSYYNTGLGVTLSSNQTANYASILRANNTNNAEMRWDAEL